MIANTLKHENLLDLKQVRSVAADKGKVDNLLYKKCSNTKRFLEVQTIKMQFQNSKLTKKKKGNVVSQGLLWECHDAH